MLLLRDRVDLVAMAMKGCSAFPKLQHNLNLTIRLFRVINRTLVGGITSLQRSNQCFLKPQPTGQYIYIYRER